MAYGQRFAQLAACLTKGTHVFVQGELTTREYNRTIQVLCGKKMIDHVNQQLIVELKAETVRVLDRSGSAEQASLGESPDQYEVPTRGTSESIT